MLRTIKNAWIRVLVAFDVCDPLKRTDAPYDFPDDCSEASAGRKVESNHL